MEGERQKGIEVTGERGTDIADSLGAAARAEPSWDSAGGHRAPPEWRTSRKASPELQERRPEVADTERCHH